LAEAQTEGAELFLPSLVISDKPLPEADKLKSAKFRLRFHAGEIKPVLWSGPGQIISEPKADSFVVEVTRPDNNAPADWKLPHSADKDLAPFLNAASYVELTPLIRQLSAKALSGEKDPARAAYKIETFVRAYINKKDLSIGFASADETARSREGDCTEHAVLCAALGRAAGLPTRTVVGLAYLPPGNVPGDKPNGSFGFHMWAEAWISPDQWVPMDAALGFDVGHIAIVKTSLEEVDPVTKLTLPIIQLMDGLKIEVLDADLLKK
jgi:transglutaminase-like putative cysteine protease